MERILKIIVVGGLVFFIFNFLTGGAFLSSLKHAGKSSHPTVSYPAASTISKHSVPFSDLQVTHKLGAILIVAAAVFILVGWGWLIVHAFLAGEPVWGLASLFFPLVALIYGGLRLERSSLPLCVSIFGYIMALTGWLVLRNG